jgi:transcriptional regulator with XRE-family HTH domain
LDYQKALGRKIAAERHRRGLSQPELARMIDRSVAWVSQVERGVRKIDRMSVLEALAAALDVPLSVLAAEAPIVAAVTEEPPGANGLRLVLSGVYALRAMLDGHRSPALRTLRGKSRQAWELTHAGRYTELTGLLNSLVPDLEMAVRSVPEDQRADVFELLATTYQACSAALAKIGEADVAWIAADRAMAAAERAGNPMLVAAGAFRLVFVFTDARHYGQAEETARTAAEALQRMTDQSDPQALSLLGGLTLQRALSRPTSTIPTLPTPSSSRPAWWPDGSARGTTSTTPSSRLPTYGFTRSLSLSSSATRAAHYEPPRRWIPAVCQPNGRPGCSSTWPALMPSAVRSVRQWLRCSTPRPSRPSRFAGMP